MGSVIDAILDKPLAEVTGADLLVVASEDGKRRLLQLGVRDYGPGWNFVVTAHRRDDGGKTNPCVCASMISETLRPAYDLIIEAEVKRVIEIEAEKKQIMGECFDCKSRHEVPGNCHIRCSNPDPVMTGKQHGIDNGWFDYPTLFDPVWKTKLCRHFDSVSNAVSDPVSRES